MKSERMPVHGGGGPRRERPWRRSLAATLTLAVAVTFVLLAGVGSTSNPTQAVEAAAGPIYWGAYVQGGVDNTALIDDFESRAGKRVSLFMFGQAWRSGGAYTSFPQAGLQRIRDRGSIPVLDWGSWDAAQGNTQPDFQLKDISSGAHDAYLRTWAQGARAWGKPFFIRFDAEMNGWWRPWSEQLNGNAAGEFAPAWRHVVDVFRQQGATNVTWIWCPNVQGPSSTPLPGLYPGSTYVDWVCMDGYNYGTDYGNKWHSFSEIFRPSAYNGYIDTYGLLGQVAPGKPIIVGETASSEDGGSKSAWITTLLGTELPVAFPNVKAFMWFNWNDNDPVKDWPIQSSPSSQAAFRAGIASSYYATNQFGGITTSPIAPIGAPPRCSAPVTSPRVRTQAVGGRLQVTIQATPVGVGQAGTLSEVRFGRFDNASVTQNGRPVTANQTVTFSPASPSATFDVGRVTAGRASTVFFTVLDSCGSWSSFVGGGATAF